MQDNTIEQDLKDRLSLIERMLAEGRRHSESWGWCFVLWGVVYYVAIAWSAWRLNAWAWPVVISIGVITTIVVASSKSGHRPSTTLGRSVGCIWIASGISMFLLFLSLGLSGRLTDLHLFVAVVSAMLGVANGSSALILRWKLQLVCAVLWWATAVAACFGAESLSLVLFLIAIFLCQIVFGVYGMLAKAQERKRHAVTSA